MTTAPTNPNKRSIILIGFRGSGKSCVGRELAKMIHRDHIDTDDVVTTQAGKSISEIFAEEGEAGFRLCEREAIAQVAGQCPAIVSVGGGAILDAANVDLLRQTGVVVWLTAPAEVLWQRISADPSTAAMRPALTDLTGLSEVEQLLSERNSHYRAASDFAIETSGSDPIEIAAEIAKRCSVAPRGD